MRTQVLRLLLAMLVSHANCCAVFAHSWETQPPPTGFMPPLCNSSPDFLPLTQPFSWTTSFCTDPVHQIFSDISLTPAKFDPHVSLYTYLNWLAEPEDSGETIRL